MTHVKQLDGLRALAILIVLVAHAGLGRVIPGGLGVTIFFFLSGYLITSLLRVELQNSGTISLKGFYIRRAYRILPPLYITLAFAALMATINVIDEPDWRTLMLDVLFLTNYSHFWTVGQGLPLPLWSLDVEEHFYMLFPIAYLALARFSARSIAALCLGISSVVLGIRLLHVFYFEQFYQVYYWSHTRIDSILFGCCLALWNNPLIDRKAWKPMKSHSVLATLMIGVTLVIRDDGFRETIRYTIQGACLFVLFSFTLHNEGIISKLLGGRLLRIIALGSYTLYLCHMLFFVALDRNLPDLDPLTRGFLGILASSTYAALMYVVVERPLVIWRKRESLAIRTPLPVNQTR